MELQEIIKHLNHLVLSEDDSDMVVSKDMLLNIRNYLVDYSVKGDVASPRMRIDSSQGATVLYEDGKLVDGITELELNCKVGEPPILTIKQAIM